jgi:heat shock protein HspQ
MIHTEEDDEFERIAHEAKLKGQPYYFKPAKDDDDDIQDYVRPWVGLTDEEILKIYSKPCGSDYIDYARAIEAKLKEKNR